MSKLDEKLKNAEEKNPFIDLLGKEQYEINIRNAEVSTKLMLERKRLGMTQKEFAKLLGVSQVMVSKMEGMKCNFSLAEIAKIEKKLNINFFEKNKDTSSLQTQNSFVEDNENAIDIISILVEKRISLNMSQDELANITGIKQPMIDKIEKYEEIPRIDTLMNIIHALGLKISFENIN